jgi:hypothetical protein
MNGSSPVTTTLTTISPAPGAEPAPSSPSESAPPAPSDKEGAGSAPVVVSPDEGTGTADSARTEDAGTTPGAGSSAADVAKRFGDVARAEQKARQREIEYQNRVASLDERESALTSKSKELEAKLAQLDEALADPVEWYLKQGKDPVEVAKRFSRPESEEARRIKKLEEAHKAREEEDKRRAEEWEKQLSERRQHEAMRSFVGSITPQEMPYLTNLYEAREVPKLVNELLNRPTPTDPDNPESPKISLQQAFRRQHGRNPTNAEIKDCLEHEARLRATRIIDWHRGQSQQPPAANAPPDTGVQPQASKKDDGPRGISNQHAKVTSTGKPAPKSLEERRKQARRDLTAALEAEAAERGSQS